MQLQNKIHSESGHHYLEEPAYGGFFAFGETDSSIELRSIIRRERLIPSGPARQARCSTPPALVRVRAPRLQRTRLQDVFLLLGF